MVQGGFYNLTAALNVTRSVAITAADAGKAVLNGQGKVQVLHIATSGTVHLAGLSITGGHTDLVRRGEIQTFFEPVRCVADHNLKFACLLELSSIAPLLGGSFPEPSVECCCRRCAGSRRPASSFFGADFFYTKD